jgi:hypothetical protein
MSVFLPVLWETTRSRNARKRWRLLNRRGRVPAGSEPAPKLSHLHLRRFANEDKAICGFGIPHSRAALVDLARANLSSVTRCVSCATLAACEGDHAVVGGGPDGSGVYRLRCACGHVSDGGTGEHAQRRASRAHRDHVARVVRTAIENGRRWT